MVISSGTCFSVKTCSTPKLTDLVQFKADSKSTYNCGDKVNKTNVCCDSMIDGNLVYKNLSEIFNFNFKTKFTFCVLKVIMLKILGGLRVHKNGM